MWQIVSHKQSGHKREVVFMKRAIELVKDLHQQTNEGICAPGGINTLVRSFTATFYFKGIRKIVREILDHCTGTCKLSKVINTAPLAPVPNRTMSVMEEIQCDLINIVCKKGVSPSCRHEFKYILTMKDCFSKYCWLTPLTSKEAHPIARIINKIFPEQGPPRYFHSDNGSEFVNSLMREVCDKYSVKIKCGRPYHPQSQGQVENLNRRVKNSLRHFLQDYPHSEHADVWPRLLECIAFF